MSIEANTPRQLGPVELSENDFGIIDFVRKYEFVLYFKQILD
jgi:hypothetical protein